MRAFVVALVISTIISAPILRADPLTDTLHEIRSVLKDPENGLGVTNRRMHKENSGNFLSLLQADLSFFALLFSALSVAITDQHKRISSRLDQLSKTRDSLIADSSKSSAQKLKPLNELAETVSLLEVDAANLAHWEDAVERARQTLLEVITNPCSETRLKLIKEILNANAYLQRRSIGVDNFSEDVQAMFLDIQGLQANTEKMNQQFVALEEYAKSGTKVPFYLQVSFSSGTANDGVGVSDGSKVAGIVTTVGTAAKLQAAQLAAAGSAAASTVMSAVATGCVIIAAAAVIYAVASYLVAAISQVNNRNRQIEAVNEINALIDAAVPSKEESDSIIDGVCGELKSNKLLEEASKTISSTNSRLDWSRFVTASASFWNSFEDVRKTIPDPQAEEIEAAMRIALKGARQSIGFQSLFRERAFESVNNQSRLEYENDWGNLENASEKKALGIILVESGIQGPRKDELTELFR